MHVLIMLNSSPVDAHPGANFIVCPHVLWIYPVVELLVDPGQERDWAVCQSIAQGLRPRRSKLVVSGSSGEILCSAGKAVEFAGSQRCGLQLCM